MKRNANQRMILKAGLASIALAAVSYMVGIVDARLMFSVSIGLLAFVLLVVIVRERTEVTRRFRRLESEVVQTRAQLSFIDPVFPIPVDWSRTSIPPTAMFQILEIIDSRNCNLIIECGCGRSTLEIARFLRARNRGQLISLEENDDWRSLISNTLERSGLSDWSVVLHRDLTDLEVSGRSIKWYDLGEGLDVPPEGVDLLLVDGPVGTASPLARSGALPRLWQYLAPDSVIILDDAQRADERVIIDSWCREYGLTASSLDVGHGLVLFERKLRGSRDHRGTD